ncbi:MAG: PAS domain-containing protein [Bacillaceae bacterium]|nr:PAS domain-containing protein [Bacillaceae bacterium]
MVKRMVGLIGIVTFLSLIQLLFLQEQNFFTLFLINLVLFGSLLVLLWRFYERKKKKEIQSLAQHLQKVSTIEEWEKYYAEYDQDFVPLQRVINQFVPHLLERVKMESMTNQRLRNILDHVQNVIILIDNQGTIEYVNRNAEQLFHVNRFEVMGKSHWRIGRESGLSKNIDYVLQTGKEIKEDIQIGTRMMEVDIIPYIGRVQGKGLVIVLYDVTERGRLERLRKEFVANVSHELKTPLTSIRGFAETLLSGALKDEKTAKEFLSIILEETERLQKLVHDLLELAKIEHQQDLKLNFEEVDVQHIIRDAIKKMSIKAREKQIALNEEMAEENLRIMADKEKMMQVLINLLSNAIKYTEEGGAVTVKIDSEGGYVNIHVRDNGIGIPNEHLDRIFERFYRVDSSRQKTSGGRGLGLSIVKHIVEQHNGNIIVKSVPGVGTEFILQFRQVS